MTTVTSSHIIEASHTVFRIMMMIMMMMMMIIIIIIINILSTSLILFGPPNHYMLYSGFKRSCLQSGSGYRCILE